MIYTPTVEKIHEFGREIGIKEIPVHSYFESWWNVLHELGHYAVKTDGYIRLWQQHKGSKVPSSDWVVSFHWQQPQGRVESKVPCFNWFDSSYKTWLLEQEKMIFGPFEDWDSDNSEFDDRRHIL